LGSGPMTTEFKNNAYGSERFLARTSAAGDLVWARSLKKTQTADVGVDPSGAPVLVGSCIYGVDLGWGDVPCANKGNGFIAKLGDSAPEYFSEMAITPDIQVGSTYSTGDLELLGVTVQPNGEAVVTGGFIGDLTIGGTPV